MNMQRIVGSPDGKHFKNVSIYHIPLLTKGLFTWSGGPRSSGVGFFCFHALEDTKRLSIALPAFDRSIAP